MSQKWPFEFPEEWFDRSIVDLRAQHGIVVLVPEERETGDLLQWSGQYLEEHSALGDEQRSLRQP